MSYSQALADRVRHALRDQRGVTEKKMFGGVGFLLHGNMLVGIWHNSLIARLTPSDAEAALREAHIRVFDVTGRPMKGWIMIDPEGLDTDQQLSHWLDLALTFVATLPRK